MSLVKGKCPLCGANIEVPNDVKDCYCNNCGEKIIASAAISFADRSAKTEPASVTTPTVSAQTASSTTSDAGIQPKQNADKTAPESNNSAPSWGSAIGLMFLAWIISGMVCCFVSFIIIVSVSVGLGIQPMFLASTGGLLALVSGVVIGSLYHTGSIKNFGQGCGWAVLIGVILGFFAAFL